ncbi:MAG: hypothetical protein IJY04_10975 [Clostridia bacterium]|nr:hypothetical protein [Clostridia bacterium]
MKEKRRSGIVCIILGILLSASAAFCGILLDAKLFADGTPVFITVIFIVSAVFTVAIALANWFLTDKFIAEKDRMNAAERESYVIDMRDRAENDIFSRVKRIHGMRVLMGWYSLFIFILSVALIFSGVIVGIHISIIVGAINFSCLLLRYIPLGGEGSAPEHAVERKDYPVLYGIADRAASELGVKKRIYLVFDGSDNASIYRSERMLAVNLGVLLLDYCTEEELYQIFLHEFSHLSKDCCPAVKEFELAERIGMIADGELSAGASEDGVFSWISALLYRYFDLRYSFEYAIYRETSERVLERIADRAIVEHGDPQKAVNALAKSQYYRYFSTDVLNLSAIELLESEVMHSDHVDITIRAFHRVRKERSELWDELMRKEIEPRISSHPIFRNRMQALGVEGYELEFPGDDENEFRREVRRAKDAVNLRVSQLWSPEMYEKRRKEDYLDLLGIVDEWLESGKAVDWDGAWRVLYALGNLKRQEDMLRFCAGLIEKYPNTVTAARAEFWLGDTLIKEYEKEGIAHIYRAVDLGVAVDAGMETVGDFCCAAGLQEELDEYRIKAREVSQKQLDVYDGLIELNDGDDVCPAEIPEELRIALHDIIEKYDTEKAVSAVYAVEKRIDGGYRSLFVLVTFEREWDDYCSDVGSEIGGAFNYYPSQYYFCQMGIYEERFDGILRSAAGVSGKKSDWRPALSVYTRAERETAELPS